MSLIKAPPSEVLQRLVILDDGKPLDFDNYRIFKNMLDMPVVNEIVYRTSRQVGKTIFMGVTAIKYAFVPFFRIKYISPSQSQTVEFSKLKLGMMLDFSPKLKHLLLSKYSPLNKNMSTDTICNNVYMKVFSTGATMKLGYACDAEGVNRIRGGSADLIMYDETQSIDLDNVVPVVNPLTESSDYKINFFAGTPIDINDPLSIKFENTTQHTMIVKCDSCGKHNTLMTIKQISRKKGGIVCLHCDSLLDVEKGFFEPMNPGAKILGFHINRLMFPITTKDPFKFKSLLDTLDNVNISENKFLQENLGIPTDNSSQLITKKDIFDCADHMNLYDPNNFREVIEKNKNTSFLVYSIDWGGGAEPMGRLAKLGAASKTVATLWKMYINNNRAHMQLLWHKVYPIENYKFSTDEILSHIAQLPNKTIITSDDRGGSYGNSAITNFILEKRPNQLYFIKCQLGESDTSVQPDASMNKLYISRSKIITKFFMKVLQKELHLPKSTEILEEYSSHLLAEVEFESESGKRLWRKRANSCDDLLFSSIFAFVSFCWQSGLKSELLN